MSEKSGSDNDTDQSNSQSLDLADLALGRGLSPDDSVGTSIPLPYPPTEKGTASEGQAHTANLSAQRTLHKSSSVESATTEQNTSPPLDTVQPPPHNITEREPGHGHYGAWSSTMLNIFVHIHPGPRSNRLDDAGHFHFSDLEMTFIRSPKVKFFADSERPISTSQ